VHADLQRLLADDLLSEFSAKPMDRLRSIRTELTEAEGDVSFVRRLTQGRLDIVGHEVERRAGIPASPAGAVAGDDGPTALLFDMPGILTDAGPGSRAGGRPVPVTEPGPVALALIETLDGIAAPSQLSGVSSVDAGALGDLFEALREFELELSSVRRTLHDRIDTIQDEIARRYRDGEASIDALLQ
jgi:hypothetical protein